MPLTAFDPSSRIISRVTPDHRDKRSRAYTVGRICERIGAVATVSKGMVDALPKKLSGKSTRGGPTIEENGTEKMNRHLLFLEFLTESVSGTKSIQRNALRY